MRFIVVDLEATCWESGTTPPRQEIIEIGAVALDGRTLQLESEFHSFVRPVVEPLLSPFCRQLTTITQAEVDTADDFKAVLPRFEAWIGSDSFSLCSWGAYDLRQFEVDCVRHRLELPATFLNHINLKQRFADLHGIRSCGMSEALKMLKLPLDGTHHRGLDDARNISKIARLILPQIVSM